MNNPDKCKDCTHIDYDETPDGENMWAFCVHPNLPANWNGRHALESDDGDSTPPATCPLDD